MGGDVIPSTWGRGQMQENNYEQLHFRKKKSGSFTVLNYLAKYAMQNKVIN